MFIANLVRKTAHWFPVRVVRSAHKWTREEEATLFVFFSFLIFLYIGVFSLVKIFFTKEEMSTLVFFFSLSLLPLSIITGFFFIFRVVSSRRAFYLSLLEFKMVAILGVILDYPYLGTVPFVVLLLSWVYHGLKFSREKKISTYYLKLI